MSTVGDLIDNIVEQETKELKAIIEDKDATIATVIADKNAEIADKDAEIARLKAIIEQNNSNKES